jgi:uncharacterized protein (DUF697 family)/uncharacterized tellurite resistance protein B-like protein
MSEVLASIRLLVAVAKADGQIHPKEREAMTLALEDVELPDGKTIDGLLDEAVDVDVQIAALGDQKLKTEAYKSAYAMAYADGECSDEERELLESLRKKLVVPEGDANAMQRMFAETKDILLPSNINPIADPDKRDREIREDIIRYSALSAAFGAFPIPGLAIASDLAVVALQVKLIRDIGQYHGHTIDSRAARSMIYALGFGTGARVAISNLVKFVPGYGSLFGATSSFGATFALGKVFDKFFKSGRAFDADNFDASALKGDVKVAKEEGKKAYDEHKDVVDAKAAETKDKLEALNTQVKAGDITQAEFEKQAAELA